MKELEITIKEKTGTGFIFYILDKGQQEKPGDNSIAVVKVTIKPSDRKTPLEKVLDIIEEQYKNQEYIVKYDKL